MTLDEEAVSLYRAAHLSWKDGNIAEALLNYRTLRMMHAMDVYYEVELPEHVKFVHPVGTVLGRATYADYFVAYQGVSVGSTVDGAYAMFTGPCVMFPGSKVIGPALIGENVWITANTVVTGVVPDNMVAFPQADSDGVISYGYKPTERFVKERFFGAV